MFSLCVADLSSMVSTRHSGYDYAPVRYTRNSSAAASADLEAAGASSSSSQEYVSTTNFMDLPSELILKITEYLPFKKVCQLRLVSSRLFFYFNTYTILLK